ncbi:40s ribosomal protein SA [Actinidia rufa]|uniref:Small ribosomal subunit protein uS2 n=1 Tax=Actinidia rufa TaxID=165716 RepID=A0A7J0G103_9ERIC|nr:40s ribosomal protein SA [Actinidia rufa]
MTTVDRALSTKEADIQMMLAAEVHLGTKHCDFQMGRYVFKRRNDGIYIINLGKTWEKLQMAARVIVAIENPQDIIVQSARPYGQRAVLKFAQYTGAHAIAGRHTPGTFTNQLQTSFSEPRLLILTDPRTDHQPIKEAALGNIPTIAFCDTDSPMRCAIQYLKGTNGMRTCFFTGSLRNQRNNKKRKQLQQQIMTMVLLQLLEPAINGVARSPDAQWAGDAVAPAIPAVPAVGWTPDAGTAVPVTGDGWDAAAPPTIPPQDTMGGWA